MVMRKTALLGIPVIVTALALPAIGQTDPASRDSFAPNGPPPSSGEPQGKADSAVSEPGKADQKATAEKKPNFRIRIQLKDTALDFFSGPAKETSSSSPNDQPPSTDSFQSLEPAMQLGLTDAIAISADDSPIPHSTANSTLTIDCGQLQLSSRVDELGQVSHELSASGDVQLMTTTGFSVKAKEALLSGRTLTLNAVEFTVPQGKLKSDKLSMEITMEIESISTSPWTPPLADRVAPKTLSPKRTPPNTPYPFTR